MSLKFNAARIIACLSTFTFGGAQSIMIALYPAIALALGIDLTTVIYCVSIGTFLFLFGSPYWSNTGNYLSRSSVLLIGTTGLCASFTIVAFLIFNPLSYSLVIILLLISQMIYGLVASATVPAAQALQMQIAEKNTAVNVAFIHTMSLNLGRVLGYSLIVLFYQRFQNVILAYSILIVSVLLILFLFHKKKVLSSPNLQKIKSAWRKEAFDIRWIIAMAMLYTCYLETLIISLAGTIKQQFNLDTLLASGFSAKILLILSIGVFLGQYIGRKLIKESWRIGMLIGILALFSGSISLIHASSLTGLWLSIANIVIGLGLIPPLYLSLLHTETASQNYSKRAGIIAAAHTLGYTTGGFLAGYTFTTPYLHIGYYLATLSLGLGFACARQIFAADQNYSKRYGYESET